jgi:hypothetical protein
MDELLVGSGEFEGVEIFGKLGFGFFEFVGPDVRF